MDYNFEWDQRKAKRNRKKHGVASELAATVFRDPRALSIFDKEHRVEEDRWMTMGISSSLALRVVHHTFQEIDATTVRIRIFSSRKATRREARQYAQR